MSGDTWQSPLGHRCGSTLEQGRRWAPGDSTAQGPFHGRGSACSQGASRRGRPAPRANIQAAEHGRAVNTQTGGGWRDKRRETVEKPGSKGKELARPVKRISEEEAGNPNRSGSSEETEPVTETPDKEKPRTRSLRW